MMVDTTEISVVPPPAPPTSQTGKPVTPDSPDAVVVGTIPEIEMAATWETATVPSTVATVETTAMVCVGANQTPSAVDIALCDVAVAVAPAPLIPCTHTGRPVTPDKPDAVVVGTTPLKTTVPLKLTDTETDTLAVIVPVTVRIVFPNQTGRPSSPEATVVVGVMLLILTVAAAAALGLPTQTAKPRCCSSLR